MRTIVTIVDALLAKAAELTGVKEKSALVRDGLRTLIRVESAQRLAALNGHAGYCRTSAADIAPVILV